MIAGKIRWLSYAGKSCMWYDKRYVIRLKSDRNQREHKIFKGCESWKACDGECWDENSTFKYERSCTIIKMKIIQLSRSEGIGNLFVGFSSDFRT